MGACLIICWTIRVVQRGGVFGAWGVVFGVHWAELWLVKNILYMVWVQIQWLEKIVYTSRFSVNFQNSQNCRQITATPRRSIFHAAKSLQMPYRATNQKITYFHSKIKNSLELRLVFLKSRQLSHRSWKPIWAQAHLGYREGGGMSDYMLDY